jgi:[ribosomal protein S5]-alanine N-acetyltransferase
MTDLGSDIGVHFTKHFQMNYILETERLKLREFDLHDASFVVELMNSKDWLQFIGDRNVRNEDAAIAFLKSGPIKSYVENGFGLWLVEVKDTGAAIGMCGILKRDSLPNPDIGFAFLPGHVGRGYAREVAKATLTYALEMLKLPAIVAITRPENNRSIRLLEALGLKLQTRISASTLGEELLLYGL